MPKATPKTRRRDPEATRSSILRAAESLFVRRGFAATSISDIAKSAGVTKSLIHHYFGSKEDLWVEMKRSRFAHWAEVQRKLLAENQPGESLLLDSADWLFRFFQENPEWVRLNLWMLLEDKRLSQPLYPDVLLGGVERLRLAQREGRIRDDVDARHVVAVLIALCAYWFMAREGGLTLLLPELGPEADAAYLADLHKILLEGALPKTDRAAGTQGTKKPRIS